MDANNRSSQKGTKATKGENFGLREDCYQFAMTIADQKAADEYFELLVYACMRLRTQEGQPADRATCESIQRQNLGYFAGYYDTETRARVERLFRCEHPVFGAIAKNGPPSAERAFALGQLEGVKTKQKGANN